MARATFLLLLLCCAGLLRAQERALAEAPACRAALDALETQTSERAPRERVQNLRQRAAAACLRGAPPEAAASQPLPSRTRAQPPVAVPPVAVAPPRPAPTAPAPPPMPTAPPLLTVSACDATGCWASNGMRLQRVGESNTLLGPGGVTCTQSGALLNCLR